MLKNAHTLAIVAVHTAENEPPKVYDFALQKSLLKTRQQGPGRRRLAEGLARGRGEGPLRFLPRKGDDDEGDCGGRILGSGGFEGSLARLACHFSSFLL